MSKAIISCGHCKKKVFAEEVIPFARYECTTCHEINEVTNVSIKEWLGFDYQEYKSFVSARVETDPFSNLVAQNKAQLEAGYLTSTQVENLKSTLNNGFSNEETIATISKNVEDLGVGPVYRMKNDNELLLNEEGNKILALSEHARSISIARTETTRIANLAAIDYYQSQGHEQYRWVSSLGPRTCDQCDSLNGQVFDIGDGPVPGQDTHALCRCSTVPIVE